MFRCIVGIVLGIGIVSLVPWTVSSFADPKVVAAPKEPPVKAVQDDRTAIADKLIQRYDCEGFNEVAFRDILKYFQDRFDTTIILDSASSTPGAAAVAQLADPTVLNTMISLPALKKVRGSTMLQEALDQIQLTYVIKPDHIRVVTWEKAAAITDQYQHDSQNSLEELLPKIRATPLVNVNLVEKPLTEAVKELERRTGRTIVLATNVGDKAKVSITVEFSNIPLDKAVDSLAEMAGLAAAKKGNLFLITSSERAEKFDDRKQIDPRQIQPFGIIGFQGNLGFAGGGFGGVAGNPLGGAKGVTWQYPEVEELNKKIAEVEKQLRELQKK